MQTRIKAGIFFGGPSRARERSFVSGRTVFDNLDRAIFDPLPIFVDNRLNFILLDWPLLYMDGIRDFFPPAEDLPPSPNAFRVYMDSLGDLPDRERDRLAGKIGRRLLPADLPRLIDLAFLLAPGPPGDEGYLQDMLAGLNIPYTGCNGNLCRSLADIPRQRRLLADAGFEVPSTLVIAKDQWKSGTAEAFFDEVADKLGLPVVVRPSDSLSTAAGAVANEEAGPDAFRELVDNAFSREAIPAYYWKSSSHFDKVDHLSLLTDLEDGLGFPIEVESPEGKSVVYHPEHLFAFLNRKAVLHAPETLFFLESSYGESSVLLEELLHGVPFSCLVLSDEDGGEIALAPMSGPPFGEETGAPDTEDSADRFRVPDLPPAQLENIRQECARAFSALQCRPFARIDGILTPMDGRIFLIRIRTMPALPPTAFAFHQSATLGLTPSQTLTMLLRQSLQERRDESPGVGAIEDLLSRLDEQITIQRSGGFEKKKIAVLLGGQAFDRQASLESGRNVFEKLSGTAEFTPLPFFLHQEDGTPAVYQIPVELLFEENTDEIHRRIDRWQSSETEEDVRADGRALTIGYGSPGLVLHPEPLVLDDLRQWVHNVFIALQGRPAENGELQAEFELLGIPFNGSSAQTNRLVFQKFQTRQILQKNGFQVPGQLLLLQHDYEADPEAALDLVERTLNFPLFARSAAGHCPPAYRRLNSRTELQAYVQLLFRPEGQQALDSRHLLKLRPREAFPRQSEILFEKMLASNGAGRFLQVTAGIITHEDQEGNLHYHVLPPSEVLPPDDPLPPEEQYRAGKNRYLTPARFADSTEQQEVRDREVKATLEKAARILNIRGYAQIDAFVRVFEAKGAETVITDIQTLPALAADSPIFRQAALEGLPPGAFLARLIETKPELETTASAEDLPAETGEPAWIGKTAEFTATPKIEKYTEKPVDQPFQFNTLSKKMTVTHYFKTAAGWFWGFFSSPFFLKNLVFLIGFLFILLIVANLILKLYTHHGESLEVHNYIGMNLDDAERQARSRSFQIVVSDSIFLVDRKPNTVLEQYPEPFSRVKENRRIYLTITSHTAPKVLLPNLDGAYNYETYRRKLIRLGLKTSIIERQYDNKLEENTILYFFHDGQKITESDLRRGIKTPKGSELQFVVTERLTSQVEVPDLLCKRYEAAAFLLSASNLVVGDVFGEVANRDSAFVYLQEPEAGQMIRMGEQVSIWLSNQKPRSCNE